MYPLLLTVFCLNVLLLSFWITCTVLKPEFWLRSSYRFNFFLLGWLSLYLIFAIYFTGPKSGDMGTGAEIAKYKLPWESGVRRIVAQSHRSLVSHWGNHKFAVDFVMQNGTEILAARDGVVVDLIDNFNALGFTSNFIAIEHIDGEKSIYAHIMLGGALVQLGDWVYQGQPIARSGMVGQTFFPHLHFNVLNAYGDSIPSYFSDVQGGIPLAGKSYISNNLKVEAIDNSVESEIDFAKTQFCIATLRLKPGSVIQLSGRGCSLQIPPCSTFKIPIAEVAFQQKIIDESDLFRWDGRKHERIELNQDQNLYQWMKHSAVWVSLLIVKRLKLADLQMHLAQVKYGNALIGPEEFWIKGPLAISVIEKVEYLSRVGSSSFNRSLDLLKDERMGAVKVSAKTGSCFFKNSASGERQVGWYVGRMREIDGESAFAARVISDPVNSFRADGQTAKRLFKKWLQKSKEVASKSMSARASLMDPMPVSNIEGH